MRTYQQWVQGLSKNLTFVQEKSRAYIRCNLCNQEVKLRHNVKLKCSNNHFWTLLGRSLLYAILIQAVPVDENRSIAGLHWCYGIRTKYFGNYHVWGKVPWQQFKNMKWWFTPILVIRRHN